MTTVKTATTSSKRTSLYVVVVQESQTANQAPLESALQMAWKLGSPLAHQAVLRPPKRPFLVLALGVKHRPEGVECWACHGDAKTPLPWEDVINARRDM